MNAVTRRAVLGSSRLVAAGSLLTLGGIGKGESSTISSVASTLTPLQPGSIGPKSFKYDPAVGRFSIAEAGNTLSLLHAGKATGNDMTRGAHAVRLFARHVEDSGLDKVFSILARKADTATDDLSGKPEVDVAFKAMQQFEPGISRQQIAKVYQLPKGAAKLAATRTLKGGLSPNYHLLADVFHTAGREYGSSRLSGNLGPASLFRYRTPGSHGESIGSLTSAVYDPSSGAHLVDASVGSVCKALLCFLITNPTISGGIGGVLTNYLAPYVGDLAAGVCFTDGVAEAIATVLTAGAALVATPIAIDICAAALASAALLQAEGASALGGIISGAIASMADSSGCSTSS